MGLDVTNRILKNDRYKIEYSYLQELEKDRIFCGHDIDHFMSVARICLILCRNAGIDADEDIIYSAALLHDIGRTYEYTRGIPHDTASASLADEILSQTGCSSEKKEQIINLILHHRKKSRTGDSLEELFYTADKKSRNCFCCPALKICNWPDEKKNLEIEV